MDLAGHPGLLVWENPDVFVPSHISDTEIDVIQYSSCECFQIKFKAVLFVGSAFGQVVTVFVMGLVMRLRGM